YHAVMNSNDAFCFADPSARLHALRMTDAVPRIVALLQLLEARVILCAVISGWPILESKIGIVCVMTCDPGSGNMIAHPTYPLSKGCRVRVRSPICLRLAQVRESAMRVGSFHVGGDGAS